MKIKVGVKIKPIVTPETITQYFSIQSFFTFYMHERFVFYRHLKDFLERFYLDLPLKEVSSGINQFRVVYKNTKPVTPIEVDEYFDFEAPDVRDCNNCEYYPGKNKICLQRTEIITKIIDHCGFWSEKD